MRELSIAYGNSRSAKQWSNKTIRFGELKERLKVTIRTSESAEEYARFPKSKKDTAKDHGGFVAGVLKGGRRKIDTVESRSMVALDGDRIDPEFLTGYEKAVPYASVLYSTHSHTAEEPRVRLVFPLARDVSPEEYVAVARYLAQGLGMDYFDECSYQPNQLMYWPSTPSNGEFVYKEAGGAWLDPDDVLSAHPEWLDPTRLPTSSRESRANSISIQKVQDPLEKEGVVGLFNRVFFPINLAMDAFLQDVYEPTDKEDRYHLTESSSMAGVEIKEGGKFAYSHHAKDPAYLKLCNAFDLVRIHKFGGLDDKASFKAMCDFALTIDSVKVEALEERRRQAGEEFADGEDWRKSLELDRKGGIKDILLRRTSVLLNCALQCLRFGVSAGSASSISLYILHSAAYPSAISRSSESSSALVSSEQYKLMSLAAFLAAGILQGKNASTFSSIYPVPYSIRSRSIMHPLPNPSGKNRIRSHPPGAAALSPRAASFPSVHIRQEGTYSCPLQL